MYHSHSCILTWLPAIFIWFPFPPCFCGEKRLPRWVWFHGRMKTCSPEEPTFGVKGLIKMGPYCPTVDFYRWFRQSSQNGHVKVKCDDMMQDTSCHYYYKSFIQMNCRSIHCLISASSFSLVSLGTLVPKGWRFSTWDLFCCFFVSAEVIKLHKNWEKQTINYNLPQVIHYISCLGW